MHGVRRLLRGPRPESVPSLVGTACTVVGLIDVAAGVFPRFRHSRMHTLAEVLPGALGPFAAALSLSAGMLLLLLAHGLKRHKRRAWRAAVVLLPVGAVAQFAYRHSIVGVLVSLTLCWLLVRHRDQFRALPDPRSRWRALANFVLLGAGSLGLGLIIVSVHPGRVVGDPSIADRLQHVLYGLFGVEGPVDYAGRTSWTVAYSLGALGLLTAVTTIYLAFRPEHPAARLTEDDESRLRELLERHGGRDSLGHFALRRDKAVVFSPSGKAAVCYRVVSGVMLAGGDPIGDVEAWPGAIERFMDEAQAHSWTPAVMGCSETGGQVWTRETGLTALELGDEAVVDVADFSLAGRAMRNVRQMVKRIERGGYETRVRRARDIGDAELDRIRRAAADWRGTDTERGFSMALGRIGDPADGDCVIATAHLPGSGTEDSPGGDLKAVLHFGPVGARRDVPGADAPRPLGRPRHERAPDRRLPPGRRKARRRPGLAELRDVPLGAGPRRAARRGAGAALLARAADLPLALVPDRVAVQVQRQVQAPLGAPLRGLPHQPGPAPHRDRGDARGGLREPLAAPPVPAPHTPPVRTHRAYAPGARGERGVSRRTAVTGDPTRPSLVV
ncbi:lysyl-tRNA synthetase, class 2 [Streptomyces sp. Ncost-T6T-2b]|nr:lysyl-tRNA synthetase, class 2 [Streptomyces sp. Ncost-T6T-2b]